MLEAVFVQHDLEYNKGEGLGNLTDWSICCLDKLISNKGCQLTSRRLIPKKINEAAKSPTMLYLEFTFKVTAFPQDSR
ncbi:hypothetical protein J6590_000755 [Homalodisca vitripennis]|nr:hypothetical protein J6590_000755 [Homalodisca vitripennis]